MQMQMQMWMFKRCDTVDTLLVGYRVLRDIILHRSSINNSASLSNKFGEFYFIVKFGVSGLLHQVVTTLADRIRACHVVADVSDSAGVRGEELNGTRMVLSGLEMSTWSIIVSGSRSTSLEEEEEVGGGTDGPAKVIPIHVVITLISSRRLEMVLLGSAP
ncbi:hypothetical protein Tco_1570057 [Tanacetum coccineum]